MELKYYNCSYTIILMHLSILVSRVRGIHLLDSMEDGTEMVAPDPFLALNAPAVEDYESHDSSSNK